jgi:hypothetical protein
MNYRSKSRYPSFEIGDKVKVISNSISNSNTGTIINIRPHSNKLPRYDVILDSERNVPLSNITKFNKHQSIQKDSIVFYKKENRFFKAKIILIEPHYDFAHIQLILEDIRAYQLKQIKIP